MKTKDIGALNKLEDRYIITDLNFAAIEKSSDELFDRIDTSKLKPIGTGELELPVTKTVICEYIYEDEHSCALRISPVDDGEHYRITVYFKSDAAIIAEASGLTREFRSCLGGMRHDLSDIGLYFDLVLDNEQLKLSPEDENSFVRSSLIKSMSNTVNFTEALRYISGRPAECDDCFVSPIADDICLLAESRVTDENVVIKKCIDNTCHIKADSQRLRIVLANLLVNGLMYNNSKVKECTLTTKRLIDGVAIKIEDNGCGFDAQRHNGELFEKWHASRGREGLGLMLAKCFCEKYGGVLEISSTVGKGSCVTMTFRDGAEEPSRNFAQVPMYNEEEIDSVQLVLSKFFRGKRPVLSLAGKVLEEDED